MKNNIKKYAILFIGLLLFSLFICKNFLQVHYSSDTWNIRFFGYLEYPNRYFLQDARIFSTLLCYIAYFFKFELDPLIIVMEFIAICIQVISTILVYSILKKYINIYSKKHNLILVMISYLIVFNYAAIEHLLFFECAIMCCSVLFSIIAVRIFISNLKCKNLLTLLTLIISIHCYQGGVGMFIVLLVLIMIISKNEPKDKIKKIITGIELFLIACLINLFDIWYINKFILNRNQGRFGLNTFLSNNFSELSKIFYETCITSFNYIVPYLNVAVLITIVLLIFLKKNRPRYSISKYLIIAIVCIFMSIYYNFFVQYGMYTLPRMAISIGAFIGISFFYLLYIYNDEWNTKNEFYIIIKTIIVICLILFFVYNSYVYINLSGQHIKANKVYFEFGNVLSQKVEEYEKNTGLEVKYIARCNDTEFNGTMTGVKYLNSLTENPLLTGFSDNSYLEVFIGKHLQWTDMDIDSYLEFFGDKNWDEFSEEQIQIKNDTVYICLF